MQIFTNTSLSYARFWVGLVAAILLSINANAVVGTPYYSNGGAAVVTNYTPHSFNYIEVTGPLGIKVKIKDGENGVLNSENAGSASLNDYATMNSAIGLLNVETIRMALTSAGAKGDRAGVVVSNVATNKNLLNLNALSAIRLVTYDGTTVQETETVSAAVAKALFESDGRPTQIEFVANKPFTAIQLEIGGVAAVSYKLNVHYAYAVPSLIQSQAKGVLSQFAATGSDLAPYYGSGTSHAGIVSVCANAGVTNPQNAVDGSLTNYAQFNSLATISCPSALSVKLATGLPAPGGYYAGFVIGNDGLLDLSVLSGLRVSTYRNGVATGESATGAGVLELRALPDGKSQVS
ncbi:MAG TPA: hypothetical protein VF598_15025, partial [Hymenobacter sp.]